MKKEIKIKDKTFPYTLKRRRGMRCMRMSVNAQGNFIVSAPRWYPLYLINKFIEEKSQWIWERLKNIEFESFSQKEKESQENYKKNKDLAKKIIGERIAFFNQYYNFSFKRISVKNQKTCWGSCSQKRNLNFNYKIINLPERERDYVIVHELCHLKELNHSHNFWQLVSEFFPNYKEIRKSIRKVL